MIRIDFAINNLFPLFCYVLYNTYDELSPLFSFQNRSQYVVDVTKKRKRYKYNGVILLLFLLPPCWIGTIPGRFSSIYIYICVCVCVCVIWYIQKRTRYLITMRRDKKETKNYIIKKKIRIKQIIRVVCWL